MLALIFPDGPKDLFDDDNLGFKYPPVLTLSFLADFVKFSGPLILALRIPFKSELFPVVL